MNAREIEIFRAVMHCRTLLAAAELLHVTQPALSKAVRHCEDRLGYQLFHRRGGRLVPTAEANALLLDADRVHAQVQAFGALARSVGGRQGGVLRVGATSSLATTVVPRALAALRREFPQSHIVLQMLPVPELEPALLARRVDLGLALSPLAVPGLSVRSAGAVRCVALVPRAHPLARRRVLEPAALSALPEIGFGLMTDFGRTVAAAFERAGVARSLAYEVGTTTSAVPLVAAGAGFAVVDGFTLDYLPHAVVAREFAPAIRRVVQMARAEGSGTAALTERFEALIEAECLMHKQAASRL